MLRRHEPLHGIVVDDYWTDIGSIQSYLQANWDALDGKVRCHIAGRREGNVWMGEGVEIGIGVQLDGPAFIGDEVKLKAGAILNEHAVIDKYSVIDDNTKISNSIVWPHSYIGERARLRQAIVCRNVTIKNDCLLEENSVVADECILGKGTQIRAGVKVWPSKSVEPGSTVNESIIWAGEWRQGLFSSYGLGGLINVELTPEFSARLGAAFCATLPKGACVVVGRDHARSSRMIKRAIVSGIVSAGGTARDVRESPVAVTQFATLEADCAGGIYVLVSPLDQRSADIRFFDTQGLQIDKRDERKLENLLFREDFRRAAFYEMGDIEYSEPVADYAAHLLKSINAEVISKAGFRVLIDYDYSDASAVLPGILNKLGVTTIPLNAGLREGAHHRTVPEETGERITLIDDTGVVMDVHESFGILASWWLRSNPGTVLAPAATPMWISDLVTQGGGTFASTPGDPASVLRASANSGTILASDGEGGFVWPGHLGAFDAMYTLVKLLELRALVGIPLSEARAALPHLAYVTATEFCPWEVKGRVMRILLDRHRTDSVDLVDGIKVYVDGGFVLVRPDPDEPAYHVVASVADAERGRELVEEYLAQVREAEGSNGAHAVVEAITAGTE
jgi:mannose-1-phosphate guanylyltransferase/phosphomannomutase